MMAHFSYTCPEHGEFKISLDRRQKTCQCPKCGAESKPIIRIGTSRVVEVLDNGAMVRKVERLHNIEDIMEERDRISTERVTPNDDSEGD